MSGKIDLNEKPICFEVYSETSKDFLYVMLEGSERMQIGNQNLGQVIEYVLNNYEERDSPITRAIAQSILSVLEEFKVVYTVNTKRYGSERKYSKNDDVPDFSGTPINDRDHFSEADDEFENPYWRCPIKIFNTHVDKNGVVAVAETETVKHIDDIVSKYHR